MESKLNMIPSETLPDDEEPKFLPIISATLERVQETEGKTPERLWANWGYSLSRIPFCYKSRLRKTHNEQFRIASLQSSYTVSNSCLGCPFNVPF